MDFLSFSLLSLSLSLSLSSHTPTQEEEDNVFLSVYSSLNHARKSDVDVKALRDENKRLVVCIHPLSLTSPPPPTPPLPISHPSLQTNTIQQELLDSARVRERDVASRLLKAERERDVACGDARDAERRLHAAERESVRLERAGTSLENTLLLERQEAEALRARLAAAQREWRDEREMMRDAQAALARDAHDAEALRTQLTAAEELAHSFRDACGRHKVEADAAGEARARADEELADARRAAERRADGDEARQAAHGKVTAALRQEIAGLEAALGRAGAEREERTQADMAAMLAMQDAAIDKDSLLMTLRADVGALEEQAAALAADKDAAVQKLARERDVVAEMLAELDGLRAERRRLGPAASAASAVSAHAAAQTEPWGAALDGATGALVPVAPGAPSVGSTGAASSTPLDAAAAGPSNPPSSSSPGAAAAAAAAAAAPTPAGFAFTPDVDVTTDGCTIDSLKTRVDAYSAETQAISDLLAAKQAALDTLRGVLEGRLRSEIDRLHTAAAGSGGGGGGNAAAAAAGAEKSPPTPTPRDWLASLPSVDPPTPSYARVGAGQARPGSSSPYQSNTDYSAGRRVPRLPHTSPSPVKFGGADAAALSAPGGVGATGREYRRTEDELRSLRLKVSNLKAFHRQLSGGGSHSPAHSPEAQAFSLRSASSGSTAIAMEAAPPLGLHDPRMLFAHLSGGGGGGGVFN